MNSLPLLPAELGFVVALPAEAAALGATRFDFGHGMPFARTAAGCVAVSGIGPERAAMAATWLVEDGARALLSWGVAGALSPLLGPGDLLVPERIASPHGQWHCDPAWRAQAATALDASGGCVWCSGEVIGSVAHKRALAAQGLDAVDMESAAVANIAARAQLPFLAIKAVCDPAWHALSAAAIGLLGDDGRLRLRRLPGVVGAGPALWRELWDLSNDFSAARRALRRAAHRLGAWQTSDAAPQIKINGTVAAGSAHRYRALP